MAPNRNNKTTTVSESVAKPINEAEMKSSIQVVANAVKGVYGDGDWDGGLGTSAVGYWVKYAQFWDAKLIFTGTGTFTLTFPFTLQDSIVRITNAATGVTTNTFVTRATTLDVALTGKTVFEIYFARNAKD